MTRYFFHLRSSLVWEDEEGCDLPDPEAARRCALSRARRMPSLDPRDSIQVTSDNGQVLFTISLVEETTSPGGPSLH